MRRLINKLIGRHSLREWWGGRLQDKITSLEWSPDGAMLAISPTAALAGLYRPGDRRPVLELETPDRCGFGQLCWNSQGTLLAGCGLDGAAYVWDVCSGERIEIIRRGFAQAETIAWSPAGDLLAIASGKRLRLWNYAERRMEEEHPLHKGSTGDLCWRIKEEELLVGTAEGVMAWRHGARRLARFSSRVEPVRLLSLDPTGRYLATAYAERSLVVRDLSSGDEVEQHGLQGDAREISWSADGRYLAVRTPAGVSVCDLAGFPATGLLLPKINTKDVLAISFQKKGCLLAIGLSMDQVGLFDPVRSGGHLGVADVHVPITILRWSPDDRWLAVAGEDGSMSLYEPC